ncbi:aminoglycoside phosphotransferase (APT) family kinase protein [Actinoplanes lutulentus]|uniref:Phosphotransferase family enzyme n=1 Tax=Actinoplanes lutulentus TaxID=1287878 RepID=A0A327ZFS2_9ACTN|nr:phosphotransferase [Actinoplanes lutulentus]MBB2948067.1 aminoglycoside phosphotransferase (APT) family kinase protein [Actinoplanes lutulentus]RAK40052.1 phosphotransferase family enzyme [Actinoplanes lutulentus]
MVTASGVRIGWADLPGHVRDRIERIIGGGPVVEALSQTGGFSPGTADRVRTADGRRAFVKAVSPSQNTDSATMARREARITALLPEHTPVPRMLGTFEQDNWVVLILEDIVGSHPRTPWVESEVDAAAAALAKLAQALTPAPDLDLPRVTDYVASDFACWAKLAADPPADLDPWLVANLGALRAASEHGLAAISHGDTLTHCDIRADNLLVRTDGRILIVDWPWGSLGPAWLDTVMLAMNVLVHGGDPSRLLVGLDPDDVTGVIAGFTGYFHWQSRLPPPPGLPTVRAFQRFQGDALVPWLRARLTA